MLQLPSVISFTQKHQLQIPFSEAWAAPQERSSAEDTVEVPEIFGWTKST